MKVVHLAFCTIWFLFRHTYASVRTLSVDIFPSVSTSAESISQFISSKEGFDAPKVKPINSSSYDVWYFDVVAQDGISSVVVAFFLEPLNAGFNVTPDFRTIVFASIAGSVSNGTLFGATLPATSGVVATVGDGSAGFWNDTGLSWSGTPDMSYYHVEINAVEKSFKGSIDLKSVSNAPE